jgi:tripartite ATP-independent transporter DctP family solute receptor
VRPEGGVEDCGSPPTPAAAAATAAQNSFDSSTERGYSYFQEAKNKGGYCMKKLLVVSLVLMLACAVFVWAGGKQEAEKGAEPEAAEMEETYSIRIGHANIAADDSALHVASATFAEQLEKYSDGRITAEIYPNAQLGNDQEMADMVVSGALEGFTTSLNLITQYAPRMRAFILPYMFENNENFRQARDELWDETNDYLGEKANMRLAVWWDSGYRHVMSRKPVRTLDDLKKLKFRVPPSPIMIEMVKSWGISPTPVEWSELFNAMQLGTVDAFECDNSVLISARMNEVVDYITNNDHQLQVSIMVISEEFYQGLPADLQEAVDKAVEAAKPIVDSRSSEILEKAIRVSKEEEGVEFLGRPSDYDQWARQARTIWPEFYKDIGGGDRAVGKEVVETIFQAAGMSGELPD